MFVYALRHKAISANPVDGVDFSGNSAQRRNRRHYPLTAEQVAAVAASVGERYPVCELLTLFAAYTGLRAEEIAGCEAGDLVFIAASTGPRAHIDVRRAKKRRAGEWVTDTLKTAKSKRTVPLPGWLAERMRDYLDNTHPAADTPKRLCGRTVRLAVRDAGAVERSHRWTSRSRSTQVRSTRTCYARPWKLLGYRRADRPPNMHPPCSGDVRPAGRPCGAAAPSRGAAPGA